MHENLQQVEEFIREYARASKGENVAEMAAYFAPAFVAVGPMCAQAVRREEFAAALPRRKQMFDSLGLRRTEMTGLEMTEMDARHVLARTRWRMTFARDGGDEALEVESLFLVERQPEGCAILAYLPCQDIMALMKGRGWMG